MKATPLIINWHDQNSPIYSCDWEKAGKGRLATAAGDGNVRVCSVYPELKYERDTNWHLVMDHRIRWRRPQD